MANDDDLVVCSKCGYETIVGETCSHCGKHLEYIRNQEGLFFSEGFPMRSLDAVVHVIKREMHHRTENFWEFKTASIRETRLEQKLISLDRIDFLSGSPPKYVVSICEDENGYVLSKVFDSETEAFLEHEEKLRALLKEVDDPGVERSPRTAAGRFSTILKRTKHSTPVNTTVTSLRTQSYSVEDTMIAAIELLVREFLEWWADPKRNPEFRSRFAPDCSYKTEWGLENEGALWLEEQQLPWEEVVVKSLDIRGDQAHVVIEGLDPILLLRRRMIFELVVRERKIQSVVVREERI